jgi:hypothetical protein
MVLYLYVLIVFSLRQESLKLILVTDPFLMWFCHKSLVGTSLNTNGKTRDHGHTCADLKKMGIRQELWLDDFVKGTELPTSCITLSKNENKELCGFLKNVKVPSSYSMNVSRLISLPELKIAPGAKSQD